MLNNLNVKIQCVENVKSVKKYKLLYCVQKF